MRPTVNEFLASISKKPVKEIIDSIYERYHVVFVQPYARMRLLDYDPKLGKLERLTNEHGKVICEFREDIVAYLEKIYKHIVSK